MSRVFVWNHYKRGERTGWKMTLSLMNLPFMYATLKSSRARTQWRVLRRSLFLSFLSPPTWRLRPLSSGYLLLTDMARERSAGSAFGARPSPMRKSPLRITYNVSASGLFWVYEIISWTVGKKCLVWNHYKRDERTR